MVSIPTPVAGYASAVVDNKIYIIGGISGALGVKTSTHIVQIFDPETSQWTNGTSMPTWIYGAAACSTSGLFAPKRIYVVGGRLYSCGANYNHVYDPETGIWSSAASLPDNRWHASLVNINDTLYAIGGLNGTTSVPSNYDWEAANQLVSTTRIQATWKYTPTGYNPNPLTAPSTIDDYTANLFPILIVAIVVIVAVAGIAVYHKKHHKRA